MRHLKAAATWYALAVGLALAPAAAEPAECGGQVVAGWVEEVRLDRLDFSLGAKLDTGADTTSIDANRIAWFKKDGADHVRFTVEARDGREVTLERAVVRIARIKNLDGPSLRRPVVLLGVCLGPIYREVEVNLAGRGRFRNRMLVGRNFLRGRVLVDSSRRFVLAPDCAAAGRR